MFELVQCWSKECAAGVGGRDVVVVSQRFPNIQTIHITAEQDYRQIICPKYFPETKSTLVLCLIFFKVFIFKICSDISSVVMCICRASLHQAAAPGRTASFQQKVETIMSKNRDEPTKSHQSFVFNPLSSSSTLQFSFQTRCNVKQSCRQSRNFRKETS